MAELYANAFLTTLAAPCTDVAGTITVLAAAPAALQGGQFRVVIGTELLLVTAGQSGTTWTVTRGIEGTTAAAHAAGSSVAHVLTAAGLAEAVSGTPISALPPVTAPAEADDLLVTAGGVSMKMTLGQVRLFAPRTYRAAILDSPGLTGYWRLGEPSGVTARDELGNCNGTYTGSPTLGVAGALAGDANPAATFNGSSQWMTTTAGGFVSATNWTLAAWVKPGSLPAANMMAVTVTTVGVDGGVQFGIGAGAGGGSGSRLQLGIVGLAWADGGYTFPDTSWRFVAMTRATGAITVYVDGAQVGTCATVPNAPSGYVGVGATPSGTFQFYGSVDEVACWSRCLGDPEIATLFALGSGA